MVSSKTGTFIAVALLLCALAGVGALRAQVLYGSLVGNVTDPSNAAIPNASVSATNNRVGQVVDVTTDERGFYAFRNLQEGVYDLKISANGFLTISRKGIPVVINTVNRVDVQLQLGNVTESVTVSAEAATLQADKADVHVDFQTRQLTNLPLPGYRNYQTLLDLIPGATPSRFQNSLIATPGRALSTNINGADRFSNTTRVDGAPNVDPWLPSHTLSVPPAESIETVNISTNSFDAEQGMAGGAAVTVSTKSGTNEFHGAAFHYHNNNAMAARNFFFLDSRRPKNIQNQYGGTLGGPIRRNKLFFFGSFEGMKQRQSFSATPTVATADQREGDFGSTGVTLYDPLSGTSDGRNRSIFSGAKIPLARQSSIARKMQSFVPLPNQPGFTSNYFVSAPLVFNRDNYDVKVNWNASSRTMVWGKYGAMFAVVQSQPMLGQGGGTGLGGGAAGSSDTLVQSAGIGFAHTVSPSLVLDGNIGFARRGQAQKVPLMGTNFGLDVLGIPGTNGPDPRQGGQPNFGVSGYESFGNPDSSKPALFNENLYSYTLNAGWTKGSHSLRFGFSLDRRAMNHWQPEISGGPRGSFTFTGGVTALNGGPAPRQFNVYADYLLGLPQTVNKSLQYIAPMTTREWFQGYYFRDQWQATRNFTVSLGLRWEYYPLMTRDHFGIQRYDPQINKVFLGRVASVPDNAGSGVSKKLFAPRIGLAYRIGSDLVIRAGYGISIDPNPASRVMRSPYPVVIGQDLSGPSSFTPFGSLAEGIPPFAPVDFGDGIIEIPKTVATVTIPKGMLERGYYQSFNFTVQRKLPWEFTGQAGYVGTRGIRPSASLNLNAGLIPGAGAGGQPLNVLFGRTAQTTIDAPTGTTNYNSLQARLDRRFSRGLLLTLSYTWSKNIDWCSDSNCSVMFSIPSDRPRNRAVSNYDRPHNLAVAGVWDLPFGRGQRWLKQGKLARALASGWQINGVLRSYSALPFTVSSSTASLNAPFNSQVADQVAPQSSKLGGIGPGHLFFDTSAFRAVTQARFGTAGRNSMRGPGFIGLDTGLFRAFALTERYQLQVRAEGYNTTNTPHFNNPNASVNSSSFGLVTSAMDDQRLVRLALRFNF